MTTEQAAPIAIIMGSQSDWQTMRHAARLLTELAIPHEARIISAHRTPERLYDFAKNAAAQGFRVIIAGAGGAAHLPGMTAALTTLPVLGVPMETQAFGGKDSLLSIVQMPAGVPVGTLAVGKAGRGQCGAAGGAHPGARRCGHCPAPGAMVGAADGRGGAQAGR